MKPDSIKLTWLMLCDDREAETRFLAAPKADPTFSDMFMNDVDDEIDDLKLTNGDDRWHS
jgi:hypothetical protein